MRKRRRRLISSLSFYWAKLRGKRFIYFHGYVKLFAYDEINEFAFEGWASLEDSADIDGCVCRIFLF